MWSGRRVLGLHTVVECLRGVPAGIVHEPDVVQLQGPGEMKRCEVQLLYDGRLGRQALPAHRRGRLEVHRHRELVQAQPGVGDGRVAVGADALAG